MMPLNGPTATTEQATQNTNTTTTTTNNPVQQNYNNNNNNNANQNNNNLGNNVASTSPSSTTSPRNSSLSSLKPTIASNSILLVDKVMVVPQQQQQQQHQQQTQPTIQYAHVQHMPAHHILAQQQQQLSPSEAGSNHPSLPASPPLLQQQTAVSVTPPQGAQLIPPVPCAVHHPQHHQQQQMALMAAMQAHMAANPMPPHPAHIHLPPPPSPLTHGHSHGPQPPPIQHGPHHAAMENGHVGSGISPSGSTTSNISSNSSGNGSNGGNVVNAASGGGGPQPPPPPPPGPLYIQYHGEFYPAEYYLAPHPHEGICPQHPHHPQPLCAIPAEFGPTAVQMVSQNRPPPPSMPVPVQVPQGQLMQQYVNENGTLTHVVLTPQQYQQLHAGQGHIPPPFLTTNGTSHFYTPITGAFVPPPPPGASGSAPNHYHTVPVGPHMVPAPPPPTTTVTQQQQPPPQTQPGTPQPQTTQQQQSGTNATQNTSGAQQQQQQSTASVGTSVSNHVTSSPNNYHNKDERTQRQHTKLLRKLEKQREYNSAVSTPAHSPSPRRQHHDNQQQVNGHNNNNNNNNNNNARSHASSHQHQQQNHYGRKTNQRNNNNNNNSNSSNTSSTSHNMQSSRLATHHNANVLTIMGSSEEGEDTSSLAGGVNAEDDEEEDYQNSIVEQLSAIQKPEVTDITSRSAKIIWEAPTCLNETTHQLINMRELRYNVLLSDRAKECKYKSLYKGSSYDCIVQDLQPGQEYVVRLQVHYEHLQGNASEPTEFTTPPSEPDQPLPPRLIMRTKNSLHLRWTNPLSNGSSIQHYLLEFDEGTTGAPAASVQSAINFVEAVKTKSKQYIMTKLQPSTVYNFRLAAANEVGPSLYSAICAYATAENPPSAPKPPTLQAVTSFSLRLMWERRPSDGATCVYILQMLNRETGHGYLNMYNGPDCSYECSQLRRATAYYFRLRAENEAGASPWSNEVSYKTAAERPARPGKPHAKGKIHGTQFRLRWDPPSDNGGIEVQRYFLEISSGGQKFERIYAGSDTEATCDRLQPGTTYQLRVACEGPGGMSPYSEISHITSEAVVPSISPPPYYDNPPGPYAAVLRLEKPDYNGGAPITEFELQLRQITAVQDQNASENATTPPQIIYRGKDAYCVVKDLQPGCTYEVQLRAINRIGAGSWSQWFRFSSAAAPPNCPEALKVTVKSATHLHVSWQEPSNCGGAPITEYRLESATASRSTTTTTVESSNHQPTTTSPPPPPSSAFQPCYQGLHTNTDIRNLLPFTLYYFRVNACNMAGVSKWSPPVNAQTLATIPSSPQIKDCEFTSNEVTLRWSKPECNGSVITAYTIEYGERTTSTPNVCTEYTISDLMPETTYKFRVQAINAMGAGSFSSYAKLTTLPSPPVAPLLECSGIGHNFIKLKWGDGRNLDFTKFYVEMYVQRAKEFQVVYSGTNCMCKVNKLQERTSYTFRICAGNDKAGVGEYSEDFLFTTTTTLPASIKAPRVAQNLTMGGLSAAVNSNSSNATNSGAIPSGLLPETPSFITGFGNLMLGLPVTLEWQHSKNSFSDRIEYMLQYAIGKDVEFKKIYRGIETKFTIENLEPGGVYQFRVCPIRIINTGEELSGAFTTPFRYQVPQLPSLDELDGNVLNNAAAGVFASMNGPCHGHAHHHHPLHSGHSHHSHNTHTHTHHNSRHSTKRNGSTLHHRSVSASAATTVRSTSSSSNYKTNANNSRNGESNSNGSSNNNTLLIGSNAIGFIPLGTMANELAATFASCDDPHHHHHHHHAFHDNATTGQCHSSASSTHSSTQSSGTTHHSPLSAASLIAASANQLFANNPILLQAAAAAASSHLNAHAAAGGGTYYGGGGHYQNAGILKRMVNKVSSVYSNRKRFSDQEKAVIFMVSFLFFTFLFATLVKMFMR